VALDAGRLRHRLGEGRIAMAGLAVEASRRMPVDQQSMRLCHGLRDDGGKVRLERADRGRPFRFGIRHRAGRQQQGAAPDGEGCRDYAQRQEKTELHGFSRLLDANVFVPGSNP